MKIRKRLAFFMAALGAVGMISGTQAQRGDRLARAGLEVGTPLPDITVYDASGSPFNLSRMKEHYSVLVFGCLT